jgi:hypothetical protein
MFMKRLFVDDRPNFADDIITETQFNGRLFHANHQKRGWLMSGCQQALKLLRRSSFI